MFHISVQQGRSQGYVPRLLCRVPFHSAVLPVLREGYSPLEGFCFGLELKHRAVEDLVTHGISLPHR